MQSQRKRAYLENGLGRTAALSVVTVTERYLAYSFLYTLYMLGKLRYIPFCLRTLGQREVEGFG